jgi:hypothetical protein
MMNTEFKIDLDKLHEVSEEDSLLFSQSLGCHLGSHDLIVGMVSEAAGTSTEDLFYWIGTIPGVDGMFYSCNPYSGDAIREWASSPDRRVGDYLFGTGLRENMVGAYIHNTVEADTRFDFTPVSVGEQAHRLEEFVALGLRVPNSAVFSGNISIHSSWTTIPTDRATWKRIQKGLVVLFDGDVLCASPIHKFRTGGIEIDGRKQSLLFSHDNPHDPHELLASIELVLAEQGIDDIEAAFEALKHAHALWKQAQNLEIDGNHEAAEQTRALALCIRDDKALPEDVGQGNEATSNSVKVIATSWTEAAPGDTLFTARTGQIGTAQQLLAGEKKIAVHCPYHNDKAPSAVLFRGNPPRLFCSVCSKSWAVSTTVGGERIGREHIKAMGRPNVNVYENKGEYIGNRWKHGPLPQVSGLQVLVGPLGSGKTQVAVEACDGKTVLTVAPTIRLVEANAERFSTINYREMEGPIMDQRATICLPSLMRVPPDRIFDVLVLDEWESLRELLYDVASNIMTQRTQDKYGKWLQTRINYNIRNRLCVLLQNTLEAGGIVVVADANLSSSGFADLLTLVNKDVHAMVHFAPSKYRPLDGQDIIHYNSRGAFLDSLVQEAKSGACGTIACDRRHSVELLSATLQKAGVPQKSILEIHRDTSDDIDPESWDQYRFVIFNQAAGSGVSYTGSKLTQSWILGTCWGPPVGWDTLRQLFARNRTATDLRGYVKEVYHRCETDYGIYREKALKRVTEGVKELRTPDGSIINQPLDVDAFEGRTRKEWVRHLRGMRAAEDFWASLVREGASIIHDNVGSEKVEKAAESKARAMSDSLKRARIKSILTAPDIDAQKANELREARDSHISLTATETASLEKWITLNRWGEVNDKLVGDTVTNSALWKKARFAAEVDDYLEHDAETLREQEYRDTNYGRVLSQSHGKELKAMAIVELLDAAGVGQQIRGFSRAIQVGVENAKGGTTLLSKTYIQKVTEKCGTTKVSTWNNKELQKNGFCRKVRQLDKIYDLHALLGIKVPVDLENNAATYLGYLLTSLGYRTKRVKVQGKRRTALNLKHAHMWTGRRVRAYARLHGIPLSVEGKRGWTFREEVSLLGAWMKQELYTPCPIISESSSTINVEAVG